MNKTKRRPPWWDYVRYMVRRYPALNKTPPGQEMSHTDLKNWRAVKSAIDYTEREEDGLARLKVIRMIHWDKTHKLEGAALEVSCNRATAARWQRRFFEEVARNRGLLD